MGLQTNIYMEQYLLWLDSSNLPDWSCCWNLFHSNMCWFKQSRILNAIGQISGISFWIINRSTVHQQQQNWKSLSRDLLFNHFYLLNFFSMQILFEWLKSNQHLIARYYRHLISCSRKWYLQICFLNMNSK